MQQVALIFPNSMQLSDYEKMIESEEYTIVNNGLTIIGKLSDREIEMAVNAYQAKVIDITTNIKL